MPNIDLNSFIKNNRIYSLRIKPPESASEGGLNIGIIKGFLTNPLSWSSSNTWEGLHQGFSAVKGVAEDINKVESIMGQLGIGGGVKEDAGVGAGQHAIQGITESIARYTGSQKPTFSFNMMLINLSPSDNIMDSVKILLKGCFPRTASKGTMEAPYGYLTGITGGYEDNDSASGAAADTAKNVWAVGVGKWFYCDKLVLSSCNVNFSQQCTPDGKPLFAELQLVFETWRLITANEVDTFFMF